MANAPEWRSLAVPAAPAAVPATTISACCQAILGYFAIDPERPALGESGYGPNAGLRIDEIRRTADHLAMTLLLPMPFGDGRMTVSTIGSPSVSLPGISLSPAIRAAAIGQPVGRLTGHPAFDGLDHLIVSDVQERADANGRRVTILRFADSAEPLFRGRCPTASRSLH